MCPSRLRQFKTPPSPCSIYVVTKYCFIRLYALETGLCVFMNGISHESILVTAQHQATSNIRGVNDRKGRVLGVDVAVDENKITPYILSKLNDTELAFKMAGRANLRDAGDLYRQQYQHLFQSGRFGRAVRAIEKAAIHHL